MSKTLNIIWQYLRAFVLIYACLYAGIFIASLLPVTIPGSIIGMLILFVLLALQILPAKWVNPGCYVLIPSAHFHSRAVQNGASVLFFIAVLDSSER